MPTRPRTYDKTIAAQLNLQPQQVAATIQLLDEGNTLPFIARYRKEMTGSLDELQLRQVTHELERLRKLDDRRDTVLDSIQGQGKLTAELEAQLNAAATLTELEDLYLPFKPKRRTRATIALENGLAPLAEYILRQADSRKNNDEAFARQFVNENVPTIEAAYDGAQDIIAEQISDHPSIRRTLREKALQFSSLRATKIDGAKDERG
ncbi:MAG: Tex-like N-terminal domain-containing protein, partial [Phototrophicaceae bacterium]